MFKSTVLVVSPTTLRKLAEAGKAVFGPGPRGVTITHADIPCAGMYGLTNVGTRTYQVTKVTDCEGVKALVLTYRRWV